MQQNDRTLADGAGAIGYNGGGISQNPARWSKTEGDVPPGPGAPKVSHSWLTAAVPMDNPYCSCKGVRHDTLGPEGPWSGHRERRRCVVDRVLRH